MKHTQHVLISLEERHANNIIGGTKKVELRRRTMHIEPGAIVWFYVKKPVGAVVGYATVGTTYSAAPSTVWRKFGAVSGLKKSEFTSYFDGASKASAMSISNPKKLKTSISLDELRKNAPGFQPPQFYCRLEMGTSLLFALNSKFEQNM
ncbi:transcriptional regulator [Uliginosibacterium aquaticum]|uniref:Transcriptional regulator n=1 Tax=Uliginosibacterium aquaticum TaxID=2731212 RepID=A0ABX2IBF4_9RHOO|nr:transcriptional regulator [Uliginosibacterium aquaticum]NSL53538.1 transcriptional regulator [Uliginosibacterium aquaticum]